jgi:hypothetical protein
VNSGQCEGGGHVLAGLWFSRMPLHQFGARRFGVRARRSLRESALPHRLTVPEKRHPGFHHPESEFLIEAFFPGVCVQDNVAV